MLLSETPIDGNLQAVDDESSISLTGVFVVLLIFLLAVIPILIGAPDSEALRYELQLALFVLFLFTLLARPRSVLMLLLVVFVYFPVLGFLVPPRKAGISFLLIALIIIAFVAARKNRSAGHLRITNISHRPLWRSYALWLGGWFIIGFAGVDVLNSAYQVALVTLFLALTAQAFVQARAFGMTPDQLWRGIKAAIWISAAFALIQIVLGLDYTLFPSLNRNVLFSAESGGMRYPGPFRDAQAFSQFLSVSLSFCLLYKPSKIDIGQIVLGSACFILLMINGSRMAPFGALVGIFVAGLITPGSRTKVALRLALLAAFILFLSLFVDLDKLAFLSRLLFAQKAASFRIGLWIKSFAIFRAYPWTGVGYENFSKVVLSFIQGGFWTTNQGVTVYNHPESGYLKILCETGIIGFLLFTFFVVTILIQYWRVLRSLKFDVPTKTLCVAGFAAYLSLLASQITVYSLDDPRILFLFGFLSVLPFLYSEEISPKNI